MPVLETKIVFNEDLLEMLGTVAIILVGVVLFYLLYFHIPIQMARNRGRSSAVWVILSFILSPVWVYIILAVIEDSDEKIKEDTVKMLQERNYIANNDNE